MSNDTPKPGTLKLPPQIKYGIAIMEMENGALVRVPINPHDLHVTMGMVMRMLGGLTEDLRTEMLAAKVLEMLAGARTTTDDDGGSLVDPH